MNAAIAAQRLDNQRIASGIARRPADVVAWHGAVQAQEYAPARWALALRMPEGIADADIAHAFDQGRILRTHVMRPTWHFVTPRDIRWMLELTAPRIHRTMAPYTRQQELNAPTLVRGAKVYERALRDGQFLTRTELGNELERARLPMKGFRLGLMTMYAELEGVVCSGPRRDKQFTYALLAERAPKAVVLPSRDEALAELVRRYLRSHGPATIRDFVWWSGLTTVDAKRGLEITRARPEVVDGLTYWTIGHGGSRTTVRSAVYLLPIYDEYLNAYRDRQAVPHGGITATAARPTTGFVHSVIVDGQVAGMWRTVSKRSGLMLDVVPHRPLTGAERRSLADAAARYGRFLGTPLSLAR
jgi:hypothetical protein